VVFDFINILSPDNSIVYTECGVGNAEIPASFYNIDVTNNIFNYRLNAINFSITIPPGNYNYTTLVTQMTTLFTANGHTFIFLLNRNSSVLTMTCSTGTWNNISASSIYFVLGFDADTTYPIVGNTITFPYLFNLLGQKKLKIYSTNISVDSYDSVSASTNNLLCTISVNQPGFNLIVYSNLDSVYGHMRNKYLSTIDIQIRDELGNLINFNGIDWTLTINLIIYRRVDVFLSELKLNKDNTIEEPSPNS